jgi:hypothetical protein
MSDSRSPGSAGPSQQRQQERREKFRPICDDLDPAFTQLAIAETCRLASDNVKAGLMPKLGVKHGFEEVIENTST